MHVRSLRIMLVVQPQVLRGSRCNFVECVKGLKVGRAVPTLNFEVGLAANRCGLPREYKNSLRGEVE